MNKLYKLKNFRGLFVLLVLLFSVAAVANSCKDDDEDEFQDHLVQFEVKGTTGAVLKTIVTQVGTSQNTIYDPTGTTWTSGEFFVNSSQSQLNLDANAVLPNADSELVINLWIDGEIVRTSKSVGSGTKVASIDYSFLEL